MHPNAKEQGTPAHAHTHAQTHIHTYTHSLGGTAHGKTPPPDSWPVRCGGGHARG